MTNNDFLKDLYKQYPWAWVRQYRNKRVAWQDLAVTDGMWCAGDEHRLRPIVPEHCEPVPEEAYAYGPDRPGAVFMREPVERPTTSGLFDGWAWDSSKWVHRTSGWTGLGRCGFGPYLISLADPHAHEIIALNRPEKCDGNHDGPPCDDPECWNGEHLRPEELDQIIAALEPALKRRGWTSPGESEWLRLDECEFEKLDGGFSVHNTSTEAAIEIIRNGPAAVRVRRKR